MRMDELTNWRGVRFPLLALRSRILLSFLVCLVAFVDEFCRSLSNKHCSIAPIATSRGSSLARPASTTPGCRRRKRLVLGFGTRVNGMRCPLTVFAKPLTEKHVAVVRVKDDRPELSDGLAVSFSRR